jgi:replicative DNA helicase
MSERYPKRAQTGAAHYLPDSNFQPEAVWAEEEFLKQVLSDSYPEEQAEVLLMLRPDQLYVGGHGCILAAAQAVSRRGPVDFMTVEQELKARGELEAVGGTARLFQLLDCGHAPSVGIARYYADVLRRAADLRRLCDLRERITAWVADTDDSPEEIRQRIVQELLHAEEPAMAGTRTLGEAIAAEVARIRSGEEVATLKFGLPAVDRLSGGLEAGEVGLVCGQPGSGKTCFTLMQAFYAAETWGPGAVVSLEMGDARLARRQLATGSGLSFNELRAARRRTGERFAAADHALVDEAGGAAMNLADRIFIETDCFRLDALISRLRFLKLRHGIRWVILDYGQLIRAAAGRDSSRTEELGYIARSLKTEIATPLEVPLWCLVQPNRNVKQRDTKKAGALLQMGDIFGASEWEAVANQIWFLNRDPAFPPAPGVTEAEVPVLLEIAKSRDDRMGFVPLTLQGERFQFVERETQREAPPARPLDEVRARRQAWEAGDE